MKFLIVGVISVIMFSGCDLQASWEGPQTSKDAPKIETPKVEAAVVPCQNVEVTQTKERTEQKVKFEGFQHIERGNFGQRNVSHCIPCTKENKSAQEKKVCEGEGSEKE